MSGLTIELPAATAPAEVRDEALVLVATLSSGARKELPPGRYWASVTLPDGDVASRSVVLDGSGDVDIRLGEDRAQQPSRALSVLPRIPDAVAPRRMRGIAPRTESADEAAAPGDRWHMRVVSAADGAPVAGAPELQAGDRPGDGEVQVAVAAASGPAVPLIVQIARAGTVPLNVALPLAPGGECRLTVRAGGGGRVEAVAEPSPHSALARSVGQYLAAGRLREAASVADAAEDLLEGKVADPIGAAMGGYALLRLGRLEMLRDWPANLAAWFDWLPDGAVIAGELAARRGDDEAARGHFRAAVDRGVPLFTDGLALVARRAAEGLVTGATARRLAALASLATIGRLTVTVRAFDPTDPRSTRRPRLQFASGHGWSAFDDPFEEG